MKSKKQNTYQIAQQIISYLSEGQSDKADQILHPFITKRINQLYTQILNKVKSLKQ